LSFRPGESKKLQEFVDPEANKSRGGYLSVRKPADWNQSCFLDRMKLCTIKVDVAMLAGINATRRGQTYKSTQAVIGILGSDLSSKT
jgi:hypothetical protein